MPCVLTMRGLIEPVELEDNFQETANNLNMHAAAGKEFVVTRTVRGENLIIKMDNILTIQEVEDEYEVPGAF